MKIRPLRGEAFMRFLRLCTCTVAKWPKWMLWETRAAAQRRIDRRKKP